MSVTFTERERVALARRLREMNALDWKEFIANWISYNTLYNAVAGTTERDRLMNVIQKFVPAMESQDILARLVGPIAFFTALPPADTRESPMNPRFRLRSSEDLIVINDTSRDPVMRLAHLMAVVYQVRCNLLHGNKDPDKKRDRRLVRKSNQVLNKVLSTLISIMER